MGISDKPWSAAGDGVARHDAMVCFVSVRVAFKAAFTIGGDMSHDHER